MAIKSVYISLDGRLSRGGMFVYGLLIPFLVFLGVISFERNSLAVFPAFLTSLEWVLLSPTLESMLSLRIRVSNSGGWAVFEWHELLKYVLFWPSLALSIKRFHDIGLSARVYFIITLIMAAGYLLIVAMALFMAHLPAGVLLVALAIIFLTSLPLLVIHFVIPGQAYENRFGPDPRDR